jgi:signal transduction histidine kinase/CheY-like chemotaxis protein
MRFENGSLRPGAKRNPEGLRWIYLLGSLPYPIWHLAGPAKAIDPWIVWWLIAAAFALVAAVSRWNAFVERNLQTFFYGCSWLVTIQILLLASLNDMHPFFAVGSVMAVLATAVSMQSRLALATYSLFALGLAAILFAWEPSARKLAYWGGCMPVVAFIYHRLSVRLTAAELLQEYQENLEQRVENRTQELSTTNERLQHEMKERARLEEELRFSQKMEAVGRLAGGVAHEFNNLVTTIGLYAEFLHDQLGEDGSAGEDVEQIQKATRQAASLTQQLLSFSRQRELDTGVIELNELLVEVSSLLRHLLGEDTELVQRLGSEPCHVLANRDQLEQALVNLALNARDATPQGGTFTIETTKVPREQMPSGEFSRRPKDLTYVLLAVSDTGVGMDSETRARVFDPFFTTKHDARGTGLGLSIVYGLVDQAGGHVRVLSEPGQGTRIELYFPSAAGLPSRRGAAPARPRRERGGERVLLVEDEDALRQALHRVLREDGYEVVEAADGEAALKIASVPGEAFDLVITDVVMPRMSGFEFAEHIRAARPDTRLLLVSGQLNHPSLRGREIPEGLTLLVKPFETSDLRATVRELLDQGAQT